MPRRTKFTYRRPALYSGTRASTQLSSQYSSIIQYQSNHISHLNNTLNTREAEYELQVDTLRALLTESNAKLSESNGRLARYKALGNHLEVKFDQAGIDIASLVAAAEQDFTSPPPSTPSAGRATVANPAVPAGVSFKIPRRLPPLFGDSDSSDDETEVVYPRNWHPSVIALRLAHPRERPSRAAGSPTTPEADSKPPAFETPSPTQPSSLGSPPLLHRTPAPWRRLTYADTTPTTYDELGLGDSSDDDSSVDTVEAFTQAEARYRRRLNRRSGRSPEELLAEVQARPQARGLFDSDDETDPDNSDTAPAGPDTSA